MNQDLPPQRIQGFVEYLRGQGYVVGLPELGDILATLAESPEPSRAQARHTLRALCCRSGREWREFDRYFREYWFPVEVEVSEQDVLAQIDPRMRGNPTAGLSGSSSAAPDSSYGDAGLRGSGAGSQKTITRGDYRFLNDRAAMRQAEVLAERMALPLKRKLSRRRVYRARGTELDIRRTIRQSLSTSGFPVKRVFRARRTMLPRLVVLHDISHSMAWNNPLLFRFCRGLVRTFDQSEAYAFHTRLFPVSEIYRTRSIDAMRRKLEQDNALGMGGTCIAQSLAEFNEQYLDGTVDSKTIVLIVSDGLDTDSVDALNVQLSRISQRARAVLWLNPMLDREGVGLTRDTLGLRFPHVVGFFPANCLEGLQQSVDEIGRIVQ